MLFVFLAIVAFAAIFAYARLQKSDVLPRIPPMLARTYEDEKPTWALTLGTLAVATFGLIVLFVITLIVLAITRPAGH